MKKIILAVDALKPAENAQRFACYLAGMTHSGLDVFFFENYVYEERPIIREVHGMPYVEPLIAGYEPEEKAKRQEVEQHIRDFAAACEEKNIQLTIHRTELGPVRELIDESRYADLIIADAATSFTGRTEHVPTDFIKDLLAGAECPVMIAPAAEATIEEIVFCYNGTRSAVFAMKQLAYLFPELYETKATVLAINKDGKIADDEKDRLTTWLHEHFHRSSIVCLKGDPDAELFAYLLKQQHVLVVMGAYGRSLISRMFKQSQADMVIKTLAYPVFIAHH